MKERKKIFRAYANRYQKARKRKKKRMLDEIAQLTGCCVIMEKKYAQDNEPM